MSKLLVKADKGHGRVAHVALHEREVLEPNFDQPVRIVHDTEVVCHVWVPLIVGDGVRCAVLPMEHHAAAAGRFFGLPFGMEIPRTARSRLTALEL